VTVGGNSTVPRCASAARLRPPRRIVRCRWCCGSSRSYDLCPSPEGELQYRISCLTQDRVVRTRDRREPALDPDRGYLPTTVREFLNKKVAITSSADTLRASLLEHKSLGPNFSGFLVIRVICGCSNTLHERGLLELRLFNPILRRDE
jgi:hypothetical protein